MKNNFFEVLRAGINTTYQEYVMVGEYEFWSMNNLQFPVRGYNIGQKYGQNAMLFNFELRFPFLLYYFPTVKYVGQIFGVMFVDDVFVALVVGRCRGRVGPRVTRTDGAHHLGVVDVSQKF